MFNRLKNIFGGKKSILPPSRFSESEYGRDYEEKKAGLEQVLGEMHNMVGHAIIPYAVGGPVDMYYFPNTRPGTAFVTMELLEPDGTGPMASSIGTYELIGFTRHKIGDESTKETFEAIDNRMRGIFTALGRYSTEAVLNPRETVEIPVDDSPNRCVILDEYRNPDQKFMVGERQHGLMLVIEVFRSEMEYAMQNGSGKVLYRLKAMGYYPYSDLDRKPVF
jgi:hypothetical protein